MISQYSKGFLTGESVLLRSITEADHAAIFAVENVMESRLLMDDSIPFPATDADHAAFLARANDSEKGNHLFAIELVGDKTVIGTTGVYGVDWKKGTGQVGISIGPDFQGKGHGTDAMRVLIDFVFTYMRLNKIKLEVYSFNPQAVASYEKCGFKVEGTLREELFRFGAYHDSHLMGLLRREWETQKTGQ
ncbi:GNAT family N-acetyltransferase [Planococcus lenghuensis]|uniref:GNAT family N-acetyltransferase n=1 Tax=Planococcus lenghuensis TaxID=2213202 RepID=A0A1Q2KVQ4_9BACL|nr:GNAT family protein [Planococcus lenghuensis]AQQ51887.1 GNAT family N-acetyltransferase [Planococcus lenghuensis]